MAKGLRASVTKRNKSKLRARVFGPIEAARTERLSAKLLELAQQPKPTRGEMDVDDTEDAKEHGTSAEEDKAAATEEGQSSMALRRALSYPIPASLCCRNGSKTSSTGTGTSDEGSSDEEEEDQLRCSERDVSLARHDGSEQLFYTLLGLSTDITGFDAWGDLQMTFEH